MFLLITILSILIPAIVLGKTVEYNIDIKYEIVNFTGQEVQAMTVGGSIPGPTLEFTEGDMLRVTFNNKMAVETSIHWHGILLPNDQDGVPYVNTFPILPGTSHTFTFPLIQSGTYWYHSHTNLQEQRGVYGAIVIHPKEEILSNDREYVVVISDWIDEDPLQVLNNLKKDGNYYALKKDTVVSLYKVFKHRAFSQWFKQIWSRMGPMDLSDVGYDKFLVNGKPHENFPSVNPGERIRLRIINASASTYYNLEFSGGKMEVIACDGINIVPLKVDRILSAVAETYDVIVTLPEDKAYELRATAQDGTGYTSAIIGQGELVSAQDLPKPNPLLMVMMDHEMPPIKHTEHGENHAQHMQHKPIGMDTPTTTTLDYTMLRARESTKLPDHNPERIIKLDLTGDMERYVWSFNGKTMTESDNILIKKGENVKFVLDNKTMMHHPLHLHGHFFRVINGQGDYVPLKHTVDVKPMGSLTIEFLANEDKDWLFHCHNLYHMLAGMMRVVHYDGSKRDPKLIEAEKKYSTEIHDDDWYFTGETGFYSNMAEGLLKASNIKNIGEVKYDTNYVDAYEIDVVYARVITNYLKLFVGGNFKKADDDNSEEPIAGIHYILPLLIEAELRFDSHGFDRVKFSGKLPLTDKSQLEWEANTDKEYRFILEYMINKSFSVIVNYDSDYRGGGGFKIRF